MRHHPIFVHVREGDAKRRRTEFINLVDAAAYSLESSLQDSTVIISAMKGLFVASEAVNCSEIKAFTDILLPHEGGFQALEWAKWVGQGERRYFEQAHSFCDGGESVITERNAQGRMVAASSRDDYLPVVFIDPLASNRPALGFDLYSDQLRSETIHKARDSGNLMVTPPIKLVQESSNKFSVLMVEPLYRQGGDAGSLEGRRKNFTGAVLGVLRIEGLVNIALAKLAGQRGFLNLHIQDLSAKGNYGVLYTEKGYSPNSHLLQQRSIQTGGRVWQLSVSGNASDFGQGWFTWYVLAGGMLLSGLLGGFLLLLTGKTLSMEALIAERTTDLANSNMRLREEIDQRVRTEKAIQKLNRSYQDLLAAASEVSIIATDPTGVITLFNRGAERMLGYLAKEVVGKKTPAVFHMPAEIEQRGLELSGEFGFPVTGFTVFACIPDIRGQEVREWTYVCKDGMCIWVSLVVTQIKSEEGETMGYLGIAQNITERRAAELALQKAKRAADIANQAKSEFLANMSHEIRTPMNGVLGMVELLRGTSLSSEQQELVETASHSANALMEIINDILDFSKIEAGKLQLDCVDFNLRELCESVCSLLAVPAQAKGLDFNCYFQPEMRPEVRGDSTRLRQILVNLIGNAVKFTFHGEISVEVQSVSAEDGNLLISFSIRDTGVGIRSEELKRLFLPFEQAEQGTTRRFGGTGLGLSISKSLVELMGGEIGVESLENVGSTFWFKVMLETTKSPQLPLEVFNLANYSVLIVDDNQTNLEILQRYIKSWGGEAATSADGKRALEMLKAAYELGRPFDIVILDKLTPEITVQEVIRPKVDTPGVEGGLPCILLCPVGIVAEPCTCPSDRVVSLSKPVRQSHLLDSLASLLGNGQVNRPVRETSPKTVLPQFSGKRLLMVEDNLVNQRVALKMLERFGLTARVASNGAEALNELEQNEFDLVLMDCQIPILDGYSVTRSYRERERSLGVARTPIVALTANAIQGDRDKSLAAGMDDHLTKPLSFKDLEVALTRWLSRPDKPHNPVTIDKLESTMSEPVWDYQATLQAALGDLEFLEELKILFIKESVKLTGLMGTADAPQPASVIATAAHSLKGMAAHFHAKTVVGLSAEVERKAKSGTIESADPLIVQLNHEVGRLIDAMGKTDSVL